MVQAFKLLPVRDVIFNYDAWRKKMHERYMHMYMEDVFRLHACVKRHTVYFYGLGLVLCQSVYSRSFFLVDVDGSRNDTCTCIKK